jgi:hypothetical protein
VPPPISLDALAADIVARSGLRFSVATNDRERDEVYRLRHLAVVEQGWAGVDPAVGDREYDAYDRRALHVIGWDGDTAVATGRLVAPPGSLPTEDACALTVEPRGLVVDVGRMTVSRSHQSASHSAFVALLARLYLEVRAAGFDIACGMMSPRARALLRLLGLQAEVLSGDRMYWGEFRAPVRFSVFVNATPPATRWQ